VSGVSTLEPEADIAELTSPEDAQIDDDILEDEVSSQQPHVGFGIFRFRFNLNNFRLGRNISERRFSIAEAALLLMLAYLASRGLGVVRQSIFNSLFGTGPAANAYYAAFRLSCCVVEIFGDIGVVECDDWLVAAVTVARDLRLLDLRTHCAMRAGTVTAIAKDPERPRTQAWSRYFYEHPEIYSLVDGLCYSNAHNDEDALALYDRAEPALHCPENAIRRLDSTGLRPTLLEIADRHNLILA